MGNRVSASIVIGGRLNATILEDLIAVILAEGLGPDYAEGFQGSSDIEHYLRSNGGSTKSEDYGHRLACVYLADNDVNGGTFEDLESFCSQYGLAFRAEWDGYGGEWSPGVRISGSANLDGDYERAGDGGSICFTLKELQKFHVIDEALSRLTALDNWQPPALDIVDDEAVEEAAEPGPPSDAAG